MTTAVNYPFDCWYVAATSDEIGRQPLGRTLLGRPVVLYRRSDGIAVALADRCAHRAFPLSRGRVENDTLVCGYHGLRYDTSGSCVKIPSQPNVPRDLGVASYAVEERPPYVWIWLGDPRRSVLSTVPELPWLSGAGWTASGTTVRVRANFMSLHEHYLDLTHIPEVHPQETPTGMEEMPPFDQVRVSETTATYERQLPRAPLADWESEWTALPRDREYERRHQATFLSPAVLVDSWRIHTDISPQPEVARVHAITPETSDTTHMFWQLARNHEVARTVVGQHVHDVLEEVMRRDVDVVETVHAAGGRAGVNISADAGALRVRRIVASMVAAERGQHARFGTVRDLREGVSA